MLLVLHIELADAKGIGKEHFIPILNNSELSVNLLNNKKPQKVLSHDEAVIKNIKAALRASNGKIYGDNGAARLLKIKPTTLQSKIKKFENKTYSLIVLFKPAPKWKALNFFYLSRE